MSLRDYLLDFRVALEKIDDYGYSESIEINEEIRANKHVNISAFVVLINGSTLHIKEYIDARYRIERLSYAYHLQNDEGKCLFRYDNAVHKPALGFKEHKHLGDDSIIEASLPQISELIDEIISYI